MSDDLLNEAGARWRAEQPPPPGFPRWRRGWRPYAVLFGAALLIGGTVYLTKPQPTAVDQPLHQPHLGALVFNGQTVEATGTIEAQPGQPVKLCGPGGFLLTSCGSSVAVEGLDKPENGEHTHLRGVWRDGLLTQATRWPIPPPEPVPAEKPVPCPTPAGGWQADNDRGALLTYVQAHPEQFRQPWVGQGKVIVIGVVQGDVAEAERTLKPLYQGSLCVVEQRDKMSIADQKSASERARPIMEDPANRIYSGWVDEEKGVYVAEVLYLTADVATKLETTGLPVEVKPWLRPVP